MTQGWMKTWNPFAKLISEVNASTSLGDLAGQTIRIPVLIEEKNVLADHFSKASGTNTFVTDGLDTVLKLNSDGGYGPGTITKQQTENTGSWEVTVKQNTSGIYAVFAYYFLSASTGANYNGDASYFIYFDQHNGKIELRKMYTSSYGNPASAPLFLDNTAGTVLIDHTPASLTGTYITVKVTRDSSGNFELFVDGTSVGTATDTTYTEFTREILGSYSSEYYNSNVYIKSIKRNDVELDLDTLFGIHSVVFEDLSGDDDEEYKLEYNLVTTAGKTDDELYVRLNELSTDMYRSTLSRWWSTTGDTSYYTDKLVIIKHGTEGGEVIQKGTASISVKSGKQRLMNADYIGRKSGELMYSIAGGELVDTEADITTLTFGLTLGTFAGTVKLYKNKTITFPG